MTRGLIARRGLIGLLTSETPAAARIRAVDLARGGALLAMAGYHLVWDLWYFRFLDVELFSAPFWLLARTLIVSAFLSIAGFCLALAHRDGFHGGRFLRRLARLVAAALLVTLATRLIQPQTFVFFGVLHHLAVASVLALAFVRLPIPALLASAFVALLLPQAIARPELATPAFWWLGLAGRGPNSNDFVPLFPWFGAVLLGIAAGRHALGRPDRLHRIERMGRTAARPWGALAFLGRHSLIFYLLHQPVLYGGTQLASWALRPTVAVPYLAPEAYLATCETAARREGATLARARAYCRCNYEGMTGAGIWAAIAEGDITPSVEAKLAAIAEDCLGREQRREEENWNRR